MAKTSIDDLVAVHRRLTASIRERTGDDLATLEGEIANIALQNRSALRERLQSRLERLRREREQIVADYDGRVRALESELSRLTEFPEERPPDEGEGRPERPVRPVNGDEETPQPGRPRRPTPRSRKRRGGG